jgi:hypothetical protein
VLGLKGKLISWLILGLLVLNAIININIFNMASNSEKEPNEPYSLPLNPRSKNYIWGQIEVISEPIFGLNINSIGGTPIIAVEEDKIYAVWPGQNNTNGAGLDWEIFYRYFDGNKWSDIEVISEPNKGFNTNTKWSESSSIAVDNGKIYVVWEDGNDTNGAGTDMDIFYRCNLTGNGWEEIQVISEPIPNSNINKGLSSSPKIAVENGEVFVVWYDDSNLSGEGAEGDILFRCNLTGSKWEDIDVISEPVIGQNFCTGGSFTPSIAVENSKIYVVWEDGNNTNDAGETDIDIFYRCNLTGNGWEDIEVISEPVIGQNFCTGDSRAPSISVENGKIYIVWGDSNNTNGAGNLDFDIFYRCNLIGSNWEDIQVISEPVFGQNFNTGRSYSPDIAVENGRVYIIWHDNNDTDGASTDTDIFYRCNNFSPNWEDIQVISEPVKGKNFNSKESAGPNIVVKKGKCHIGWRDMNNTNGAGSGFDSFYRWVQVPTSPLFLKSLRVTPKLGNTSTEFNFTVKYFHLNNSEPTGVNIYIDDNIHQMLEVDSSDLNYINGKDYFFKVKNLDIGNHSFRFWASNGTNNTITKLFNIPKVLNTPPGIIAQDNQTAIEDTYYESTYEFADIDIENVGQICYWEFDTNASWLKIISIPANNYLTMYGTPRNDDVGIYSVDIKVNDGLDFDQRKFNITVLDVNDRPEIITENVITTNEDVLYQVYYKASDIDSTIKHQLWSMETNATDWLGMNTTSGELNGIPTNDDVGIFWINITVNDTEGGIDFTNFTLEVINVNDPPVITPVKISSATTGQLYELDFDASDVDSDISNQSWKMVTNASWLSIDESSGLISVVPPHSEDGWFSVNVTVDDGDGGFDWYNFDLKVIKGNENPEIVSKDKQNALVNELYNNDYEALDDPLQVDLLFWILESNATWLSLNPDTGVLSGTPKLTDGGRSFWVNISVTDGYNGWDYHNFTLTVHPEPIIENNKPRMMNFKMTPIDGNTETEFSFSVYYSDSDSEPPTIIQVVIGGVEHNMEFQPGGKKYNGQYEFTTTLTEGEHTYYFTTSDGRDTVRSDEFKTPYIIKPQVKEEKEEGENSIALVAAIVIIIIIVLVLVFLLLQRKKKKETETTEEVQKQSETSPEVYPTVINQQVPIQPQQQPVQPQVPVQQIQPVHPMQYDTSYYNPTPVEQPQIEQTQFIEQPDQLQDDALVIESQDSANQELNENLEE